MIFFTEQTRKFCFDLCLFYFADKKRASAANKAPQQKRMGRKSQTTRQNSESVFYSLFSYGDKNLDQYFNIDLTYFNTIQSAWLPQSHQKLAGNVPLQRWNHFVLIYDGQKRACYLNGKKVSDQYLKLKTSATRLMIGSRIYDPNHCYVGGVRNIAIYDRVLSTEEVAILQKYGIFNWEEE